ncbi:hypothetical protein [Halarcobacter ebronensis]|uniref:Uncharacterized protein n=1 Tax=Halarcobacter ebronensis TaxID=1462615 RepID=A0A4Q1ATV6_9BACT|nr:hypothetical protein [Halarcobacter ebronensis]QKF82352.1 putative membrane protein [Halarcobacter ebronensis]RXK07620.1 hypothetical protein CRV07_03930 [Halarcobacter ebronensis]
MEEIKDKELIHYKWVLNRIQTIKYLIVTTILALMAYTGSSIDITNDFLSLAILSIASIFLLISLYLAGKDAGASIFYIEQSQEGISKESRVIMYVLILISSTLIFIAKILNTLEMITTNSAMMR